LNLRDGLSVNVMSPSASMHRWISAFAIAGIIAGRAASNVVNIAARQVVPGAGALECHLIRESRSHGASAPPGGV
jgi:hypothetical protein